MLKATFHTNSDIKVIHWAMEHGFFTKNIPDKKYTLETSVSGRDDSNITVLLYWMITLSLYGYIWRTSNYTMHQNSFCPITNGRGLWWVVEKRYGLTGLYIDSNLASLEQLIQQSHETEWKTDENEPIIDDTLDKRIQGIFPSPFVIYMLLFTCQLLENIRILKWNLT